MFKIQHYVSSLIVQGLLFFFSNKFHLFLLFLFVHLFLLPLCISIRFSLSVTCSSTHLFLLFGASQPFFSCSLFHLSFSCSQYCFHYFSLSLYFHVSFYLFIFHSGPLSCFTFSPWCTISLSLCLVMSAYLSSSLFPPLHMFHFVFFSLSPAFILSSIQSIFPPLDQCTMCSYCLSICINKKQPPAESR